MTATTHARSTSAAQGAPRPQPRPQRRPATVPVPRPYLRLVEPGEIRARRRARLLTGTLVAAACAGLFVIVALRVLLAQGQVEIDRLEAGIETAQATQQDLRLTVAEREAPAHIVAAARQRLGMMTPPAVTYLNPPPAPPAAAVPSGPPAAAVPSGPPAAAR